MSNELWEKRQANETHDSWCYALMKKIRLFDGLYIENPIGFKDRLKSLHDSTGLKNLLQNLNTIQPDSALGEEFGDLLKRKVPFELLIEYIGAPEVDPTMETKSVIYNRLAKNHLRPTYSENFKDKVGHMISFAAFAGSFTFCAATTATLFLPPTHPVSELARSMAEFLPGALKSFVPQGNLIYTNAHEIALALFATIGLGSAYQQWSKGRSAPVELHSKIAKLSNPLAEDFFSYASKEVTIKPILDGLSNADKHLLSHLSPYEMRTVLSSSPEVTQELLEYLRPSFAQRKSALAGSESFFSYMGHMMGAAVLPSTLRKPLADILERYENTAVGQAFDAKFVDSFDSSRAFSERLKRFRETPSASSSPSGLTP